MQGILKVLLLLSLVLFIGCTKDSGSNEGSPLVLDTAPTESESSSSVLCGVFTDNQFHPVVPFENAESVQVRAISADLVVVTRTTGEQAGNSQLVKLEGITTSGISSAKLSRAADFINQVTSFGSTFLSAGSSCVVTFNDGGEGIFGQVFTNDGKSLSELLVQKGFAHPESGACGGNELAGCYAGIPVEEEFSSTVIRKVLWKPVSESDGKLVLLTDAFGVNVAIEGNTSSMAGNNRGPSNGYGSTIRYPYPGCSYGNARLRFYDSADRTIRLGNGESSLSIKSGCSRAELNF